MSQIKLNIKHCTCQFKKILNDCDYFNANDEGNRKTSTTLLNSVVESFSVHVLVSVQRNGNVTKRSLFPSCGSSFLRLLTIKRLIYL